jgi:hypothetical protein
VVAAVAAGDAQARARHLVVGGAAMAVTAIALVHSVPPDGFTGMRPPSSNSPSRSCAIESPGRATSFAASIAWNSVLLNGA